MNQTPSFHCYDCEDTGMIPIYHYSTDGLMGYRICQKWHPAIWKPLSDTKPELFVKSAHLPPF